MDHPLGDNNPWCESNAELGLGLICACLPALNILTTLIQLHMSFFTKCGRGRENSAQPSTHVFDCPQSSGQRYPFSRSQLNSCAHRGNLD
jgi:hypothetical protein